LIGRRSPRTEKSAITRHGSDFGALIPLALVLALALPAGAQSVSDPPAGTIAAEMKAQKDRPSPYGGLIDVTAINTTLIAIDKQNRAVLDLRPEELLVFEDGEPVQLLGLTPGLGPDETSRSSSASPDDDSAGPKNGVAQPWRVVVYVGTELAGRFVLPNLCRRTAAEANRLTDLGPVDIVLADPTPTLVTEAGRQPEVVRESLELLARDASGVTTVEQIRNAFLREFRPGVGFDQRITITQSSPQTFAIKARASVNRERTIVRGELDRMVAWLQSQPPAQRGLLVWMTGGFDLNPADFYIPLVEQIDPGLAAPLRTDYPTLSLEADVKQMIEVALSYGWTVLPVNSSAADFIYEAEIGGAGRVQHFQGVSGSAISTQTGDFSQVAPTYPLRIIARATGGEVIINDERFVRALDHIRGAYMVTYQVDRPADGRLHRLEIRCTRPGVKLRGRRYAASGSLRGVAVTRAQRFLAGEKIEGGLDMTAEVHNITNGAKGQRTGDLDVSADLRELRSVLSALDLGQMRVTVVVEIEHGSPFIHHQEIDLDWNQTGDMWQFGAGFKWPKRATRAGIVLEELVTSTWGAATITLK
jgi:hypothetical protein